MQNLTETQVTVHVRPEIKIGKYEFLIQGFTTTDSNGYQLKSKKNGSPYTRLRIILLDEENNSSVIKNIFSDKDTKEIVMGIGNPALTHVYNSDPKSFDLDNLVGETGTLFLGKNKEFYNVECFIKPRPHEVAIKQVSNETGSSFKKELEEADNVPF